MMALLNHIPMVPWCYLSPQKISSILCMTLEKKNLNNHDKYISDKTLFSISIGGFQDLKNIIKLKNGKQVTLLHLLKNIPASTSMSRPQLFQQADPNLSVVVTIVTSQAQDHELVMARQASLEADIWQIIVDGEAPNVFVDDTEGIWFGGVNKLKTGRLTIPEQMLKKRLINKSLILTDSWILLPKKRSTPPPTRGSGIPHPLRQSNNTPPPTLHIPTPSTTLNATPNFTSFYSEFDVICSEINKQYACITNFDARIGTLTRNIDTKIDRLLDRFETPPPLAHKLPRTSHDSTTDAMSYPRHTSDYTEEGTHESCLP